MHDLEANERQIAEKGSLLQELMDQIDGYCKTIDQKDKELKKHKRGREDAKKELEWKEKKLGGMEEDIGLQKKQLALMEKEIHMRENEVEERESSLLTEIAEMKDALAKKDGKIERLTSDLMEVKEYIEEEAKLVTEKDKEMEELKEELKKEKELNQTNDPKSIREMARKQFHAELTKEKRRHEQDVKKLKQKVIGLEEKYKEEQILRQELEKQNETSSKNFGEEKAKLELEIKGLREKLESQQRARLNDKKKSDDVEMRFWSEEEKYVEEIRAIELSRQKLKVENESLKGEMEVLDDVKEQLVEKTREIEQLKMDLEELSRAKKEEKEMMNKLISEGEEVIRLYEVEVQQLKSKLNHEPAISPQESVSDSVEDARRLIELEYKIGKETKTFDSKSDEEIDQESLKIMQRESIVDKRRCSFLLQPRQRSVWKYSWYSLILILVFTLVLHGQFPYHVIMMSVLLYLSTLGFLIWKDVERSRSLLKQGETSDVLSKAINDIYDENQNLRKTVEQLIVRVASESVEKNELARKLAPGGATPARDPTSNKELLKQLEEKTRTIQALQDIRKELAEEGKQLKAKQRAHEGALEQQKKVIKKLEEKLQDVVDGEGVDISTEEILQEIRDEDERRDLKKKEALERFHKLATNMVENTRHQKILSGIIVGVVVVFGVVFMLCCKQMTPLGFSFLATTMITLALVFALVMKSRTEVAKLTQELNEEVTRGLECSNEIQELSTLVEKHVEVVTKQKRAIAALERQVKVEHERNENQKLIIAKLTWTIQEGKDIENLLGRSGTYRGQDKEALGQALKKMAEDHVKEKLELFKSMRAHLADEDVDSEDKRWILEDVKQATKDITKTLPGVPRSNCLVGECKGVWKLGVVCMTCVVAFLWMFYGKYYGLSLLPLAICVVFVVPTDTGTKYEMSCDVSWRCLVMDILFVCFSMATVSLAHSNGYLQETAFVIVLVTGVIRMAIKKLGVNDTSRISVKKSQEIEELRDRVREEVRRQKRMADQMETMKRLLDVERAYNKESGEIISGVRETEQKAHRELRQEMEKVKKEKKERVKQIEELEKELKNYTMHNSKQRRQMAELSRVIKELEKRQKQGSREIDMLKELNKYEKDELNVALNEEKRAKEEILKNVETEKEKVKHEISGKLSKEKEELEKVMAELQKKLQEERKLAKDFLDQVDSELKKNEKMNGEIEAMKSQMEQDRETREDLRKRFREINKIRQDREKILLHQIDELQNEIANHKMMVEKLTQELEENVENSKKNRTKTLCEIQEKQISELQARLSAATKTIEDLRRQDKETAKDLEDSRVRQGKLLKDLSKLQGKSAQDQKIIQKKQKEIKELKTSLEKLKTENEKLARKLEVALLEDSLNTKLVMGVGEISEENIRVKEDVEEPLGINEEEETSKREGRYSVNFCETDHYNNRAANP